MAPQETLEREDIEGLDAQKIAREAEQTAIDRVAKRQGLISEIKTEQKDVIKDLFTKTGGEGAALMENSPVMKQSLEQVEKDATDREGRFSEGVRVANLPGNVVGEENDVTRTVRVDGSMAKVETQKAQSEEVDTHEYRHKQQKLSNDEAEAVPVTGDAEIDEMLETEHLAFREEDAMFAAGDEFTAESYTTDYKKPVNRVESFLNQRGKEGTKLVRDAGLNGKMKEVRSALLEVFVEEQLEKYQDN